MFFPRTKCPKHNANTVMIRPSMKCAPDLWVLMIENRSVNDTKTSTVMPIGARNKNIAETSCQQRRSIEFAQFLKIPCVNVPEN